MNDLFDFEYFIGEKEATMGAFDEELLKDELKIIEQELMPAEKQQFQNVREHVKNMTIDYELSKDFRYVCSTQCGKLTFAAMDDKDPIELATRLAKGQRTAVREAASEAAQEIRLKILENPLFERYV